MPGCLSVQGAGVGTKQFLQALLTVTPLPLGRPASMGASIIPGGSPTVTCVSPPQTHRRPGRNSLEAAETTAQSGCVPYLESTASTAPGLDTWFPALGWPHMCHDPSQDRHPQTPAPHDGLVPVTQVSHSSPTSTLLSITSANAATRVTKSGSVPSHPSDTSQGARKRPNPTPDS